LCLLMATPVLAVDTITQTLDCYGGNPPDVCVWTMTWLDDTANGVSARMGTDQNGNSIFQQIKGYYAGSIITVPGSPAPTDQYDATLLDDFGIDLAGGLLANRATATPERIVPKKDATNTVYGGTELLTPVTLAISDASQNQAGATGKVIVVFWRN
jgi:hypothetical protein